MAAHAEIFPSAESWFVYAFAGNTHFIAREYNQRRD
jgi:hypothetical protein